MNILLKRSCLLNIHEELEEREAMNMNKSNLMGFLRKGEGRHSILLLSCNSIFPFTVTFTFNSATTRFTRKVKLGCLPFLVNYQCFSAEGLAYI